MRRLLTATVALAGLLLAAPPAAATVLLHLSTDQLTARASHVVMGSVLDQDVVEAEGKLWTDTRVRVTEALAGPARPGDVLVLRQPGGETPTRGLHVAGAAQFEAGEEVLLFARPVQGQSFLVPVGASLGKYTLYVDAGGTRRARRDLAGASVARFDARGKMVIEPVSQAPKRGVPLAALVSTIQASLKQGGAR